MKKAWLDIISISNGNGNSNCFWMQYQWQYQYQLFVEYNTNCNTNTNCFWNAISMAIPIPIVCVIQYQWQYQYQFFFLCNFNINCNSNTFNCLRTNSNVQAINSYWNLPISIAIPIVPDLHKQLSMAMAIPSKTAIPMAPQYYCSCLLWRQFNGFFILLSRFRWMLKILFWMHENFSCLQFHLICNHYKDLQSYKKIIYHYKNFIVSVVKSFQWQLW